MPASRFRDPASMQAEGAWTMTATQRSLKVILAVVVIFVFVLTLGAAPAHGQPKAPATPGPSNQSLLQAEADAGRAVRPVSPQPARDMSAILGRIEQSFTAAGARHSFAGFVDVATRRIVIETDAPAAVVAGVVGTVATPVEV